ncbi:MAG: flagellar motor protein MotB [Candidatus Marinimicrobia bacterium]|nr:flagellar motor protein MotB [Candidatus Neomarinimicrobiota bacterium]
MARKNPAPGAEEGLPDWFATFADLMTLLMTFFVLLFSMATLDPVKIADLAASMEKNMTASRRPKVKIKTQSQIHKEVKQVIQKMQMQEMAEVSHSPKGTTITIDSRFAFTSGQAILRADIFPFLDSIIPIMTDRGNKFPIAVEGHTDNEPTTGAIATRFPTNWELSGARAASVVRYCMSKGVPGGKMRAVGFADRVPYGTSWRQTRLGVTEEMVRAGNTTEELRSANRRVEITFLAVG